MIKQDPLYKDYEFSRGYPIMGKIWKFKCHFCGKDLRKVPKRSIVKGEVAWGFGDECHLSRHWWCSEECAKDWYSQQQSMDITKKRVKADLNKRIKGE